LKNASKTIIDADGFVKLPIRVYGSRDKSVKLIGILDTGSSYTVIPKFACQLLNLPAFDRQNPDITVLTGSGYMQAPFRKAYQIEIVEATFTKQTCPSCATTSQGA
jgi:hypothetical protein